uniref:U81-Liphistoxin-Lth1a_1 n=1 Tax=Liphistius thaleban TaxID=1905330 RepID=A0A4Q8K610_9ARAC
MHFHSCMDFVLLAYHCQLQTLYCRGSDRQIAIMQHCCSYSAGSKVENQLHHRTAKGLHRQSLDLQPGYRNSPLPAWNMQNSGLQAEDRPACYCCNTMQDRNR